MPKERTDTLNAKFPLVILFVEFAPQLLAYPWFAMLAVTLAGLIEGLRRPQMVLIGQYYCWVASTKM